MSLSVLSLITPKLLPTINCYPPFTVMYSSRALHTLACNHLSLSIVLQPPLHINNNLISKKCGLEGVWCVPHFWRMSETYTPSLCWWRQALWCAGRHPVCPLACRLWLHVYNYNCCTSYTGLRPLPSSRRHNAYFWHTCIVMLHARWGGGPCGTTNHSIPSLMGWRKNIYIHEEC